MSSIANQTNDDSLGTLLYSDTFNGAGNSVAYTVKNNWYTATKKCVCFITTPYANFDFGMNFDKNAEYQPNSNDFYYYNSYHTWNGKDSETFMSLLTSHKIQTNGNSIVFELEEGDYFSVSMRAMTNEKILLKVFSK